MFGYLSKLVGDMTDEELARPVPGAVNPPAYILGHLAICNDSALDLLGQPAICPPAWHEAFAPGRTPSEVDFEYPSKDELLTKIGEGVERICASAPHASPEAMARPQTFPFFKNTPIKTVGDCVALLMTTHFSLHAGQLSVMRRQLGRPPLF